MTCREVWRTSPVTAPAAFRHTLAVSSELNLNLHLQRAPHQWHTATRPWTQVTSATPTEHCLYTSSKK